MNKSQLLIFAHRGEAQAFLSHYKFLPVPFFFDGLFKSDFLYLLITGEGTQSASEKTVAVLASFATEALINEVINIGVAGSLDENFKVNDLIWIRSSYAQHAEKLEFKSFQTSKQYGHLTGDCMSVYKRVIDSSERENLSHFASIIDRELWAIGSACHLFKIPFLSLKIISDDLKSHDLTICQTIKENALVFSNQLLLEFLKKDSQLPLPVIPKSEPALLNDVDFYFTVSSQRKFISLISRLNIKESDFEATAFFNQTILDLKKEKLNSKDRTRLLLQHLTESLNPMALKIKGHIDLNTAPLKVAGIAIMHDGDYEQDWLQLSFKIESSRDLLKMRNALSLFSYEDYKKIMNGEFD